MYLHDITQNQGATKKPGRNEGVRRRNSSPQLDALACMGRGSRLAAKETDVPNQFRGEWYAAFCVCLASLGKAL